MSFGYICISYGNTRVVYYGNQSACCNGNIIFMYSTGVSVRNDYRTAGFCSSDMCGCQSAVGGAVIAIANVLTYVSYGLPIYGICKENKVLRGFAPMVFTASQSGRLSSDHEESRR